MGLQEHFYAALHFQVIFAREEKKGKTQVNIKAFDPNKSHDLLKPWRFAFTFLSPLTGRWRT